MADKTLRHQGYQGSIEVSVEDRCLHGRILFIDDLITYEGDTVPALEANFAASVERYLADCTACGKSPNRPCSGVFQIRIGPELHRATLQAAARECVPLNEFVTRAICLYVENPRAIDVNHHHDHAARVTLHAFDQGTLRSLTAESEAPTSWMPIPSTALSEVPILKMAQC